MDTAEDMVSCDDLGLNFLISEDRISVISVSDNFPHGSTSRAPQPGDTLICVDDSQKSIYGFQSLKNKLTEVLEETATFVFMDAEGSFFDVVFQGRPRPPSNVATELVEEPVQEQVHEHVSYNDDEHERRSPETVASHTIKQPPGEEPAVGHGRDVRWAVEADKIMEQARRKIEQALMQERDSLRALQEETEVKRRKSRSQREAQLRLQMQRERLKHQLQVDQSRWQSR
ncbi:hypothetical protein GUITHDRAFT_108465 [Guillardia theta CCMP2712]|uniref:Uncharacterized protein n=1 Tax=Guillardia theta (strain CCMP2712) TaxID=905079 RepID=L1JAN5_GUITC|nr:hypothetical protein GUITHDRAFT_108465 [Guillardia theta CCMP2712]EKX45591.1 hypothetical protein GUITHDRAFT_108465 [Guillardia theta CCMP2712]|eukprot:XP_005832571.1 hypothetical protein GUITHDRAFT_108465 [Guillardia theta CCMP2712]